MYTYHYQLEDAVVLFRPAAYFYDSASPVRLAVVVPFFGPDCSDAVGENKPQAVTVIPGGPDRTLFNYQATVKYAAMTDISKRVD